MDEAPIVWLLQDPGIKRDYESCLGYGHMVTVLENNEQPSKDPLACLEALRLRLREAGPHDYFLFAGGDPMTPFCAGFVLAERGWREIKWLRWDRRTNNDGTRSSHGYYTPVTLAIPTPEDD